MNNINGLTLETDIKKHTKKYSKLKHDSHFTLKLKPNSLDEIGY